jgi:hypothetical protein
MFHVVARSIDGGPLFGTWAEARRLWDVVVGVTHGRAALTLMPNHLHLLHPRDVRVPLAAALSGFARWTNHVHGTSGPLFAELPPAQPIVGRQKQRRQVRYVHLNPCRAKLTTDPLRWPFSTHRDACGLALPGVISRSHEIASFHRYVSSDDTTNVSGTILPEAKSEVADPLAVLHAVSAVTRTPLSWFTRRKLPARQLYLRAALRLCPKARKDEICDLVGLHRNAAGRAAVGMDPDVEIVARAVGDPRFRPLHDKLLPWSVNGGTGRLRSA